MGSFAAYLDRAMDRAGFRGRGRQARLARETGIRADYINRMLAGHPERPEMETLRKLARPLGDLEGLARAASRLPELAPGEATLAANPPSPAGGLFATLLDERPDIDDKFLRLQAKYADRPQVAEVIIRRVLRAIASNIDGILDTALSDI